VEALFQTGRIVDLILLLMVVEGAGLLLLRRRLGRGMPASEILAFLAAGATLMLGLRAALVGAGWGWIALALAVGGAAHLAFLLLRWRG
jgi:hypothetical protein